MEMEFRGQIFTFDKNIMLSKIRFLQHKSLDNTNFILTIVRTSRSQKSVIPQLCSYKSMVAIFLTNPPCVTAIRFNIEIVK